MVGQGRRDYAVQPKKEDRLPPTEVVALIAGPLHGAARVYHRLIMHRAPLRPTPLERRPRHRDRIRMTEWPASLSVSFFIVNQQLQHWNVSSDYCHV